MMSLTKKLKLCREFGVKVVLSDLMATNIRIPRITSRWKDRVIQAFLCGACGFRVKRTPPKS